MSAQGRPRERGARTLLSAQVRPAMSATLALDDEAQALPRLPRDADAMRKAELMEYAKTLGVETRREGQDGKKNLWRPVPDVKRDCKEAQARHCQPVGSQARTLAPGAGPASASHMVDNARADVNPGPHMAKKGQKGIASARHRQSKRPPAWCQALPAPRAATLPETSTGSQRTLTTCERPSYAERQLRWASTPKPNETARFSGRSAIDQWRVRARC